MVKFIPWVAALLVAAPVLPARADNLIIINQPPVRRTVRVIQYPPVKPYYNRDYKPYYNRAFVRRHPSYRAVVRTDPDRYRPHRVILVPRSAVPRVRTVIIDH